MNEIIGDAKSAIIWLLGVVMALLAWLGKRQINRIDSLERESVTRKELAETLTQMREDRQQMHSENKAEFRYIRERVDAIADRQ
jgi:cell division protein FtsB